MALVLAVSIGVTAFLLCVAGMLAVSIGRQCGSEGADSSLFLLSQALWTAAAAVNAFGCCSYFYVSASGPRPWQLHGHGLVLMLITPQLLAAMLAELCDCEEMYASAYIVSGVAVGLWCVHRVLFFNLMVQKIQALGRPSSYCAGIQPWGKVLMGSVLSVALGGVIPSSLFSAALVARGYSHEEINDWGHLHRVLPTAERCVLWLIALFGFGGASSILISGSGFMAVAVHRTHSALKKMAQRQVSKELLDRARRTVLQHLAGLLLSTLSNHVVILAGLIFPFNLVSEDVEMAIFSVVHFLDLIGDIAGILLLSGIGASIWLDNPEAGDAAAEIRSVIHSAVLTSRAQTAFEGCLALTPSRACIVSFPGKFMPEWNTLTWLCEHGELSSACVFLPTSDPKQRFGEHSPCPDTPNKCWCSSLYGSSRPWGCKWFEAWRSNVEVAVSLKLDLIVVFFPGQVGQGIVAWDDLGSTDLWDGVGLGGSQKAEVAYLQKQGIPFLQEDLTATQSLIRPSSSRKNRGLALKAKAHSTALNGGC